MKNELIKSIGLELTNIRRSRELQIINVSKATGLNKDTISKYENGNSSISASLYNTFKSALKRIDKIESMQQS